MPHLYPNLSVSIWHTKQLRETFDLKCRDTIHCIQVNLLLQSSAAVDLRKMTISSGRAFWRANVDIYVLDMDGSILDACLLSAIAALSSLKALPNVIMDDSGVRASHYGKHDIWRPPSMPKGCRSRCSNLSARLSPQ